MQGDDQVQLVVLCAEKPTSVVLKRVFQELPAQLKKIAEDSKYTVQMAPVDGAVMVTDGSISVKVSLTSPLLREPAGKSLALKINRRDMQLTCNEKFFDFELPVSPFCSISFIIHTCI